MLIISSVGLVVNILNLGIAISNKNGHAIFGWATAACGYAALLFGNL